MAHGGVVAATLFAIPDSWRPDLSAPVIVPIDLVTVAETTNVPLPEPEPEPEPAEPEPEPEQVFSDEIPAPAPLPEPTADGVPALPEPEDEPEPRPEPEPAPPPEPESRPIAPERVAALKPRVKPRPRDELDFGRLSALIDRARDETPRRRPRETPADAPEAEEEDSVAGSAFDGALTLSEEDALRMRMYACWSLPGLGGGANLENKIVSIRINLNPDGTINGSPTVLQRNRILGSGDPFLIAAADSAVRAVLRCAPYDFLPAEKYESWKEITMRFDPSDMLGR